MIYVRFMGGLGNQLFQYSVYRKIAELSNQVRMDNHGYNPNSAHNGYELDRIFNIIGEYSELPGVGQANKYTYKISIAEYRFRMAVRKVLNCVRRRGQSNSDSNVATEESISITISSTPSAAKRSLGKRIYSGIICKIHAFVRIVFKLRNFHIQYLLDYNLVLNPMNPSEKARIDNGWNHMRQAILKHTQKKNPRPICVYGFWHHPCFYADRLDKLQDELAFKIPLTDKNKDIHTRISDPSICSVSLHIRRGDYVTAGLYLLQPEYYQRAVELIEKDYKEPLYLVFSDDIPWVKENLLFLKDRNVVFVDWNKGEDSYIDMQLMSCCKHNIVANSTFSFWGAVLNRHEDKIVVCPSTRGVPHLPFVKNANLVCLDVE